VVAAYGLILPQAVLDLPRFGCLNIHASLLPRWRGAAPIQRAILAGDTETGITIMQMDAGLDTGAMLSKTVVPIRDTDTAASLHDPGCCRSAAIVAAVQITHALPRIRRRPGHHAAKLSKDEANWTGPPAALARPCAPTIPCRGVDPTDGAPLKIWSAQASAAQVRREVLRADTDQLLTPAAVARWPCGISQRAASEWRPPLPRRPAAGRGRHLWP
jgi:methionyl-tRNA formyltransferase